MMLIVLILSCFSVVRVEGVYILNNFFEVGFVSVASDNFDSKVSTLNSYSKPRVIMGVPTNGIGSVGEVGLQSCFRLDNIKVLDNNLAVFNVRLVQPNDTWCNYTWWHPVAQPLQVAAYLIMEESHWKINGAEFDIRTKHLYGRCNAFFYRVNFYQPFSRNVRPAVIAQAQTYDDIRFVSYNIVDSNLNNGGVSIFVLLHNAQRKFRPLPGDCIPGHYTDHYDNNRFRQAYTVGIESVAIFAYTPTQVGLCKEGISFETRTVAYITSDPKFLPY